MEQSKSRKKNAIIAAFAILLVAIAVIGTVAWLTAQSSLTNNFTTAGINVPTTDPDDPDLPITTDTTKVNGNLVENSWVANSKLGGGLEVDKDPNVGLGADSDDAYVYVYVGNATYDASASADYSDVTYFTLNSGWKAVNAISYTSGSETRYISGLFVYVGTGTDAAILEASDTADVWTGEMFSKVITPTGATKSDIADSPKIFVNSFVYAATAGATSGDGSAADAATSAASWASGLDSTYAAQVSYVGAGTVDYSTLSN